MKKGVLGAILAVLALGGSAFAGEEPDGSMRVWLDGEYLLWWLRPGGASQPLLTTGPLSSISGSGSAVLGRPGTEVLSGNQGFNTGPYSGFRVSGGWMNCAGTFGVDGNFFYLAPHSTSNGSFASDPNGNPVLARPVIDANTGSETALFVAAPGAFSGSLDLSSTTNIYGFDANLLFPYCRGCCDDDVIKYVTFLGGFRYFNLRDDLGLTQNTTVLPRGISFFDGLPVTPGSSLTVSDNLRALNQFYGGQIGVKAGLTWWRFTLNGAAKVALGSMQQEVTNNGSTTVHPVGQSTLTFAPNQSVPGGLYTNPGTNFGAHTRNITDVIPEGDLQVAVEITPQIKLTLGYTIIYVSDVARAGSQIDRTVNRLLVPTSQAFNPALGAISGPQRPGFGFSGTDFWAQGVNIGLSLRF